jgi:hypothetical protein
MITHHITVFLAPSPKDAKYFEVHISILLPLVKVYSQYQSPVAQDLV